MKMGITSESSDIENLQAKLLLFTEIGSRNPTHYFMKPLAPWMSIINRNKKKKTLCMLIYIDCEYWYTYNYLNILVGLFCFYFLIKILWNSTSKDSI